MNIYMYKGQKYTSLKEVGKACNIAFAPNVPPEFLQELGVTVTEEEPPVNLEEQLQIQAYCAKNYLQDTAIYVMPDTPKEVVDSQGLNEDGSPMVLDYRQYLYTIITPTPEEEPLPMTLALGIPDSSSRVRPVLSFQEWKKAQAAKKNKV